MIAGKWITEAQKSGWRVKQVKGLILDLSCKRHGCPGAMSLPLANLGPVPDPCNLPHKGQYGREAYGKYQDLVDELRRRRRMLGLSQEDVNSAAGFADGHLNKLEAMHRTAQFPTLQLWAETLGLSITITPTNLPSATARTIETRANQPYDEAKANHKFRAPVSDGACDDR